MSIVLAAWLALALQDPSAAAPSAAAPFPVDDPCAELRAQIAATYDFVPHALVGDAAREEKSAAMDAFWTSVKEHAEAWTPCLDAALRAPDADPWFRLDGSALLVEIAPGEASKALHTRLWCEADFADVDALHWLRVLLGRAREGFDVSRGAERWLGSTQSAFVPAHALKIGPFQGALILFGSMDESLATPALIRIAQTAAEPVRGGAISLLVMQATPAAWNAIGKLDLASLPPNARPGLAKLRKAPPALPGDKPKLRVTRVDLVRDLEARERGERLPGAPLSPHDWVINAARELKPTDVDLLRRVRRKSIQSLSDEALIDYGMFTAALQALTWSKANFK